MRPPYKDLLQMGLSGTTSSCGKMGILKNLRSTDPEIFIGIRNELKRQRNSLEMIPSENFASVSVISALGTVLNNKYSEGYPKKEILWRQ